MIAKALHLADNSAKSAIGGEGMVQDNFGATAAQFSVGGVINAGVSIVLRNVPQFLAICFLMSIPTLALMALLFATFPAGPGALQGGAKLDLSQVGTGTKILFALVFIVAFMSYFVIQAALNYAAFQNLRGERATIGACIARGLAAMPRLILACLVLLLIMIGVVIGGSTVVGIVVGGIGIASGSAGMSTGLSILALVAFMALFLFLFVIWWVFVPAIVAENAGPVGCFGRSRSLTKGHRWGIFGILLLVTLANILAGLLLQFLGLLGVPLLASILNAIVSLFFAALSAVLSAVGYYYLRAEKEGFGVTDLAGVFD